MSDSYTHDLEPTTRVEYEEKAYPPVLADNLSPNKENTLSKEPRIEDPASIESNTSHRKPSNNESVV